MPDVDNTASPELKSHNIAFMYFHLLIDILLKMSANIDSSSKQDLINHLRRVNNEQSALKVIDEFEQNYKAENAIWWYTRDTFLYVQLNEALRRSDFDVLFAFRFFIADLYKQLTIEHERLQTDYAAMSNDSSILKVYRGQSISNEELALLRENQNGFFSMQSFLSTSLNSNIGQIYVESAAQPTDTHVRILYEFNIDTRLQTTKPYAKINHLSRFEHEDEVLLALGSVFHIDNVQFNDINQIWQAKLTLCDDNSFDLYGLMKQYASEIVYDRVSPGFLLYQLGKYTKAKEYFQKILKEKHLTDSEKAHCYRGLGTVAAELYNFDEAHENFETELQIWLRLDDEDNIMETRKNIGNMLFYKGKYQEALDCLQTAGLYFRLKNNFMEYCRIYGMIAHITGAWQQWNDCLVCYEAQLEARERELDPNHEDIGITHANIGVTYHCMGNYEEAVNHFRKALDIYRTSLSEDHPNVEKAKRNLHTSELELQKKNISEDHTDQSIR
ncbi:unnamed protein product [Rotaria sp. Silwood2]|nr:unnamed protein product [Rotaria sp. Silwood2]CAF4257179.1 unnamed protein product [Rotaria sp. Silwood2]